MGKLLWFAFFFAKLVSQSSIGVVKFLDEVGGTGG